MMSLVYSACPCGVEAVPVTVEVDVRANNLRVSIVGLPDMATRESKDRLIPAITNSGFAVDRDEIIINLGPAELRKEGTGFDLPMAIGILVSKGIIDKTRIEGMMLLGELALDGSLRQVRGVLAATECARDQGFASVVVPIQNGPEALLVGGIQVFEVDSLSQLVQHLRGREPLLPAEPRTEISIESQSSGVPDFLDVKGQVGVKRVLEIAAAGKHNLLMFGPPGSGKSMLGKRLPGILPGMTPQEMLEVTRIYSCVGKLKPGTHAVLHRPFRAPHHTASAISIVGGGANPRPGEVTQAHRGVLFLDEFPEFPRTVLEVLRQPLEDRHVTISRASSQVTFPADFMLVAAMNPCPCGWRGDPKHSCSCSEQRINNYRSRLSGPLLDRIDLHVEVPALPLSLIRKLPPSETTAQIRARVTRARERQRLRFDDGLTTNASMSQSQLGQSCALPSPMADWLEQKLEARGCSKRVHDKILRVARTIADLGERDQIGQNDLLEALSYRQLDYENAANRRDPKEVAS